jgi:hypothetical protein
MSEVVVLISTWSSSRVAAVNLVVPGTSLKILYHFLQERAVSIADGWDAEELTLVSWRYALMM